MMKNRLSITKKEEYRELNSICGRVDSVLFGADVFDKLPVAELIHQLGLNISASNRSVEGLTVQKAAELLDECVFQLKPSKVFLNFGDMELQAGDCGQKAFLAGYEALIREIQSHLSCKIHIISVLAKSPEAAQLNAGLRKLAEKTGCRFVDVSESLEQERPLLYLFRQLSYYMRESRITFTEAMNMASA